jgi:hypothetical protein
MMSVFDLAPVAAPPELVVIKRSPGDLVGDGAVVGASESRVTGRDRRAFSVDRTLPPDVIAPTTGSAFRSLLVRATVDQEERSQ